MKLGLYKWFCKLREAYQRFDSSDEVRLLLVLFCCVITGSAIAVLDFVKNMLILTKYLGDDIFFLVYAPLWNLELTLAQLWDICLALIAFNVAVALVTVWNLGKRAGKREVIE